MALANPLNISTAGIPVMSSSGVFTANTTTNHNVVVGATSNGFTAVAPSTSGYVLTSNGASSDPSFQAIPSVTPGWTLLSTATASTSATLDFTTSIDSTYNQYCFVANHLVPDTNSVTFKMLVSTDGGSNWIVTNYKGSLTVPTASVTNQTTFIQLSYTTDCSTSTSIGWNGQIYVYVPATFFVCTFNGVYQGASSVPSAIGGASYTVATAVNAVRFLFSSGNISSGSIKLYGVSKP